MAKKPFEFKRPKIEGTVCSGCIQLFPDKEMIIVSMPAGYTTPYCSKCIEKDNISDDRIKGNMLELRKEENKKSSPWKNVKKQE